MADMRPEGVHLGQALPVVAATCVSAAAGAALRAGELPRAAYQPRAAAFALWWAIYASLLLTASQLLVRPAAGVPMVQIVCSLLGTACWVALVRTRPTLAAAALVASATLSATALLVARPSIRRAADVFTYAGPALLAGWLLVAAALGIDVWRQRAGQAPAPSVAPLYAAAAAGAVLTVGTRFFVAGLPLCWAAAWLPADTPHRAALIALAGTATAVSAAWGAVAR